MREPIPWTTDPETMVRMIEDRDRVIIAQRDQLDNLLTELRDWVQSQPFVITGLGDCGLPKHAQQIDSIINDWEAAQ